MVANSVSYAIAKCLEPVADSLSRHNVSASLGVLVGKVAMVGLA
ncbi:MAG: hypothetical protein V1724_08805 [Chloroflexota bacterium]